MQQAVELALLTGRFAGGLLAPGLGQQCGQSQLGRSRVLVDEVGEREASVQQAIAPAFGAVHQVHRALVTFLVHGQGLLDGAGVHAAHQLADVLHLASQALVAFGAAGLVDGLGQVFGHRHASQLLGRQLHQPLAQRLQCVHLLLPAGLADGGVVCGRCGVRSGVGGVGVAAAVVHERSGGRWMVECYMILVRFFPIFTLVHFP